MHKVQAQSTDAQEPVNDKGRNRSTTTRVERQSIVDNVDRDHSARRRNDDRQLRSKSTRTPTVGDNVGDKLVKHKIDTVHQRRRPALTLTERFDRYGQPREHTRERSRTTRRKRQLKRRVAHAQCPDSAARRRRTLRTEGNKRKIVAVYNLEKLIETTHCKDLSDHRRRDDDHHPNPRLAGAVDGHGHSAQTRTTDVLERAEINDEIAIAGMNHTFNSTTKIVGGLKTRKTPGDHDDGKHAITASDDLHENSPEGESARER